MVFRFVALDSAYDVGRICEIIVASGRVPVIKPRKNSVVRGYSSRTKMIKWCREKHDDFMQTYANRNLAEAVFACMKK